MNWKSIVLVAVISGAVGSIFTLAFLARVSSKAGDTKEIARPLSAPRQASSQYPESHQAPLIPKPQPPKPTGAAPPEEVRVVVHAYELWRNPVQYKGKIVLLDACDYPSVYRGQPVGGYIPVSPSNYGATQLGYVGLQFYRVISGVSICSIRALNLSPGAGGIETVGYLGVTGSAAGDVTELRPCKALWRVEPLRAAQGTNSVGGPVQIPVVKFWGYAKGTTTVAPGPQP